MKIKIIRCIILVVFTSTFYSCDPPTSNPISQESIDLYGTYWTTNVENPFFESLEIGKSDYVAEKDSTFKIGEFEINASQITLEGIGTFQIVSNNDESMTLRAETNLRKNIEEDIIFILFKVEVKVIENEITNLLSKGSWTVAKSEPGILEIGSKWILSRSGRNYVKGNGDKNHYLWYWDYIDSSTISFRHWEKEVIPGPKAGIQHWDIQHISENKLVLAYYLHEGKLIFRGEYIR